MLDKQEFSFDILGLYNGSMLMKDRQSDNLWSCYNGVALYGPRRGQALARVPAVLCSLSEWLEEHPGSEILEWTSHPHHEDPRHGHGCWFHFGGEGQHPHALATMLDGELDGRLSESELVLGVCHASGEVAYPLAEVHRQGRLIHDTLGDEPVVAWARSAASSWIAAYSRRHGGKSLEFEVAGEGRFRDAGGSVWTVEGKAVEGPCAGQQLTALDFVSVKWNAWAGFYPHTKVYRGPESARAPISPDGFQPLLDALKHAGMEVSVVGELLTGSLPAAAERGLRADLAGDPFLIYRFNTAAAAGDFAESRLLLPRDRFTSFFPAEEPSDLARHSTVGGRFVLESNPGRQYADSASLERLPEAQIQHSPLLDNPRFQKAVASLAEGTTAGGPFASLFLTLRNAGFQVARVKPMLRQWLEPHTVDGYSAEIRGDRFLVYRFADSEAAAAYQARRHHTVQAGVFVLRSDPPDQYHVHSEQTYNRPVEEVSWSTLLDDRGFLDALKGSGSHPPAAAGAPGG